MRKSNEKSEQVTKSGIVLVDYAEILDKEEMADIFLKHFPNTEYKNGYVYGKIDNKKFAICFKNVSYLGSPHPLHKKRIQIPLSFKDFYLNNKRMGFETLLIGVYKYNDNLVFVDFDVNTYTKRKTHNSSAHVFINDLRNASIHKAFKKTDRNENVILTFSSSIINDYLEQKLCKEEIFELPFIYYFDDFFDGIEKNLKGKECYKQMYDSNYVNAKQAEWPGFYMEYMLEKYINKFDIKTVVQFLHNKTKDKYDLDLYFPTVKSYGDLKTHENKSNAILGNDLKTVNSVTKDNSLYYIVCNHNAIKDINKNSEVTIFWNKLCNKKDLHSYEKKMKNSIEITDYEILEINKFNKKYLKVFNQGRNSNLKAREPKIMIKNTDINNFLIHHKKY